MSCQSCRERRGGAGARAEPGPSRAHGKRVSLRQWRIPSGGKQPCPLPLPSPGHTVTEDPGSPLHASSPCRAAARAGPGSRGHRLAWELEAASAVSSLPGRRAPSALAAGHPHCGAPCPEQAEGSWAAPGTGSLHRASHILQASLRNGSPGGRSKRWYKPEETVYLQRCSDRREASRRRGQQLATKTSSSLLLPGRGAARWPAAGLRKARESGVAGVTRRRVFSPPGLTLPCLLRGVRS